MPARLLFPRKLRWLLLHYGPRREERVATPHGPITFDSRDRGIGKTVYLQRGYELASIRAAIACLRRLGWLTPPGHVVDVGANIGITVIPLLAEGGFQGAIAVEPEPGNFRLLCRNVEQNQLGGRVHCVECALSDVNDHVTMELSPDNWGDHRLRVGRPARGESFRESERRTLQVRRRTLDSLVLELSGITAESIRLIWLDVQGHEAHFMRGARGILSRGVPVVSEIWPYGLARAGTDAKRYMETVSEFFEGFIPLPSEGAVQPIAALAGWFARLEQPRQMGQIILVPRAKPTGPQK